MDNLNIEADFCLQIDFERNSKDPARVFRSMSDLIESFHQVDIDLASSIDIKIKPELILQDIQTGSLKSFLRNHLEAIDDSDLKELNWKKIVGGYLHEAKYSLMEFLRDKDEITERQQIEGLRNELLQLAEATDVKRFPSYTPIPLPKIIDDIKRITSPITILSAKDNVLYITDEGIIPFNKKFNIDPEKVEDLITKETITNQSEMILKVKKPDYLGESMWDFKHDKSGISAKIQDTKWLQKFQSRETDIRPGDSIRAVVEIEVKYGFTGEVVATHYRILEVIETLTLKGNSQSELFK